MPPPEPRTLPYFRFALDQPVTLQSSEEEGIVIGRAEYVRDENQYLVAYKAADGRAVEAWWRESALWGG